MWGDERGYTGDMSTAVAPRAEVPARLAIAIGVIVALLGLGAAALAWYRVADKLTNAHPVTVPAIHDVTGVIWSNRVFSSQEALTRWLRPRGLTYAGWATRHPALAKILTQSG